MGLVKEVNTKTLIEVVKQLKSMRSTYRSLHRYEIPVGNPIEKNIKNISCQLEKLSGICLKGAGKDSDEAYENIPIGKSKKQGSSVNEGEVFGGNTRSRCARMDNKMEIKNEV